MEPCLLKPRSRWESVTTLGNQPDHPKISISHCLVSQQT